MPSLRKSKPCMKSQMRVVKKSIDKAGLCRVSGDADLRKTQTYPSGCGAKVREELLKAELCVPQTT
eukprot:9908017-Prorocentrum_lima.AAC.1